MATKRGGHLVVEDSDDNEQGLPQATNNELEAPPPRPKKRRRRVSDDSDSEPGPATKNLRQTNSAYAAQFEESEDAISEQELVFSKAPKSKKRTYTDRNLAQLAKVNKALQNLQINKDSVVDIAEFMSHTMDTFFDSDYTEKQFSLVRVKKGTPKLYSTGKKKSGKNQFQMFMQGPNETEFNLFFNDNVDEDDLKDTAALNQLADLLETFFNSLAEIFPFAAIPDDRGLHHAVVELALEKAIPQTYELATPSWDDGRGLRISLPYLDENTGKREWYAFKLTTALELLPNAPSLPANAKLFVRGLKNGKTYVDNSYTCVPQDILLGKKKPQLKSGGQPRLPPKDPSKFLGSEQFMRLCYWKLNNRICTHSKMKQMKEHLQRIYTTDPELSIAKGYSMRSAGYGLFCIKRRKAGGTVISAGRAMLRELKADLDPVTTLIGVNLGSLDAQWIAVCLQAGKQLFITTGSVLEALLGMAETVDQANIQIRHGLPPPNWCSCTTEMENHTMHVCSGCIRDVLCKDRKQNSSGLFVCPSCLEKDDGQSLVDRRVVITLKQEVRKEAEKLGQDPNDKDNQRILREATQNVLDLAQGTGTTKYLDGYTQQRFETMSGFDPRNQCVDGVLPNFPDHRWQLRNHVKGNLLPTNNSLNMGKGPARRNLPADLGSASDFRRNITATNDPTQDDLKKMRRELLLDGDSHNEVQCKYKLNPSAQRGAFVTPDQWSAMHAEFVSGKLSNADHKVNHAAKRHARRILLKADLVPCEWDDEERALVKYWGRQAGVSRWSKDDAPFPFVDVDMPDEFSENGWDVLFSLMRMRLYRMTLYCNKYWITIDTELTLLAEWLYQVVYEHGQRKEFLGLPVTCFINHALLASVAHKVHGKQMRTAYTGTPKDLFDRKDDLCNILIETVLSNFLKMDYHHSFYDDIVKMFDSISVPLRFFNPNLSPPESTVFGKTEDPDELDYTIDDLHAITEADAERFNEEDGDRDWEEMED